MLGDRSLSGSPSAISPRASSFFHSTNSKRDVQIFDSPADNASADDCHISAGYTSENHEGNFAEKLDRNIPFKIVMVALLIVSLFLYLSWVLGNGSDSQNDAINAVLVAIFIVFVVEIGIMGAFKRGYLFSFFFWTDVLGTLTILLDVGWIMQSALREENGIVVGEVVRMSRATRVLKFGMQAGRLLRLYNTFSRLDENLYMSLSTRGGPRPTLTYESSRSNDLERTRDVVHNITRNVTTQFSYRVAAMVIILAIIIPFMHYNSGDASTYAWIDSMKFVAASSANSTSPSTELESLVTSFYQFYADHQDLKPLHVHIQTPWGTPIDTVFPQRPVLRDANVIDYDDHYWAFPVTVSGQRNGSSLVRYDIWVSMDGTVAAQWEAFFGIMLIILVIIVVVAFSTSFRMLAYNLMVGPLEKAFFVVRKSARHILESVGGLRQEFGGTSKISQLQHELDFDPDGVLVKVVEKVSQILKHLKGPRKLTIADPSVDPVTKRWIEQTYDAATTPNDEKDTKLRFVLPRGKSSKQLLSGESQRVVELASLNSWSFDTLSYSEDELSTIVMHVFLGAMKLSDEFKIPPTVLLSFLHDVEERYVQSNPYHNYKHGCDVFHTVFRLLTVIGLSEVFSPLENCALLVAALAHDVGHLGVNNLFLVKARDELAIKHNDRSPLENMHCTLLYEILKRNESNIFMHLTDTQWRQARKIILTSILGTDMAMHFETVSKLQVFSEVNANDTLDLCCATDFQRDSFACFNEESKRIFIMEVTLHCADISGAVKPFGIMKKWSDLVCEEFCLQGDREKNEGLEVSPMMDRDQINLPNMQLGFIEYVVAPLYTSFIHTFPVLHGLGFQMLDNFTQWASIRRSELMMRSGGPDVFQELCTLDERLQKFREQMAFLTEMKTVEFRPPRVYTRVASIIALDLISGRELSADEMMSSSQHGSSGGGGGGSGGAYCEEDKASNVADNAHNATQEDSDSIPPPPPREGLEEQERGMVMYIDTTATDS